MRRASLIAGLALVVGCTVDPPCASNAACGPLGMCIGEAATGEGRCLSACDFDNPCQDGAWCRYVEGSMVCWDGGTTGEGEIALDPGDCAFGLAATPDYTAEPLVDRCMPSCSFYRENDGCSEEEQCLGETCGSLDCHTRPCGPLDHCVYGMCINERRYARLDCDGDSYPDCYPGQICDPEVIGGCSYPPYEER